VSRIRRRLLVAALASAAVALVLSATTGATAGSSFSKTETISRTHLVDGADQVVDTRTFHVTVDQTTQLRDRQEINVSWSGAHPTGGLVGDTNSQFAAQQEYPVAIMECRGLDNGSLPASKRLSPETCWTHTAAERAQSSLSFQWPSYRLDRYATPADRRARVGVPSPLPPACLSLGSGVQHWIPFKAADGSVYAGGADGCAGIAPDAVTYEGSLQPSNTTYAQTDLQGKGSTKFVISTADSNASLGCSNTAPCSLVIIPIMGLSCDPDAANLPEDDRPPADVRDLAFSRCAATGQFQPGEFAGAPNIEDLSVSGLLWWSESNWRNRITVPLRFAQSANICDARKDSAPVYVYGSELVTAATLQWAPRFCLDPKLFKLAHVQTGEPQAKNLLQNGTIEAAFEAAPPQTPFQRPTVQAPTALTGFAITFQVDDGSGHPLQTLRLTPRLLAKLLTESYAGLTVVQSTYPALANNPLDLAQDPEFTALNPGAPAPGYNTPPAATLYSLSSDSDVIWALSSYINADPDARAWLDGKPDPWGMVVNPAYKGIELPVVSWPLLDDFAEGWLYTNDGNMCLAQDPTPILPLIAAPVATLAQLALNMQFGVANSQIVCKDSGSITQKLAAVGRENPGQRFILGITSLADAERYRLDAASLLTHTDPGAASKFTSAAGRTFVPPEDASLRAAARMFQPVEQDGTWVLPYDKLRSSADGTGAYPGTMLVSTAVPTQGLPMTDAKRYAEFLRFVAGEGQQPGFGNGQLPPGYLPMTASNGMSTFAHYTQLAADAVAAQQGGTVSVTTLNTTTSPSNGDGTDGSGTPPAGTGSGGTDTTGPGGSGPTGTGGSGPDADVPAIGETLSVGSGPGGLAAPLALGLAVILALAAGGTWFFGRPKVAA